MAQLSSTPGAAEVIGVLLANWQAEIRGGIERMQRSGKVRESVDPERTASAFVAGIQGGVQVLRSTGRIETLRSTLDLLIEYLRLP
jgi:hypothetical protein